MAHTRGIGIASATWISGAFLLFLLFIAPANANSNVTLGPVKGDVYLNERLNVHISIQGNQGFSASQLHPSCLKGEIIDRSQAASFETIVQDAIIRFESTIRNGGLLKIQSSDKILSPLSILQIKSVCPLAQFDHSWSLLASPPLADANPKTINFTEQSSQTQSLQSPREFKLSDSTLLSESRKVPDAWLTAKQQVALYEEKKAREQRNSEFLQQEAELARYQPPVEELLKQNEGSALTDSGTETENTESNTVEKIKDERVEIAQAQLESFTQKSYPSDELLNPDNPDTTYDTSISADDFSLDTTTALAILLITLLILSSAYYIAKKHGLAKLKAIVLRKQSTQNAEPGLNIQPELMARHEYEDQDKNNSKDDNEEETISTPGRMFQSLLDDDNEEIYQELNEVHKPEQASTLTDSASDIIELLKVDRQYPWDQPDSYRAIIEQHSIELSNAEWQEMRLSKSQIAIVELAFKKALVEEGVLESEYDLILDYMNIREKDEEKALEDNHISELVKNFVTAKIFEQEDKQLVSRFVENLAGLAMLLTSRTLCFGSESWIEFVESLRQD